VIDAVHQRHPRQKAEEEADDGRSFVHHGKPRNHRSLETSVIEFAPRSGARDFRQYR
jgi:hypothetical protein